MAKRKAARKKSTRRKASSTRPEALLSKVALPVEVRPWTVLVYLCGDSDAICQESDNNLAELKSVAPTLRNLHLAVQHDTRKDGARRYLIEDGQWTVVNSEPVRINTGDPREAVNFFKWGIEKAPSRQVALIFSGLGIDTQNLERILNQQYRFGARNDSLDFDGLSLFSICHDESHLDALQPKELKGVIHAVRDHLERPVDLLGFDASSTAFIEFAYQFRGAARSMVAPGGPLPPSGWPYKQILRDLDEFIGEHPDADSNALAKRMASHVASATRIAADSTKSDGPAPTHAVAINLDAMSDAAMLIDHAASTLLHHLGDWHVLNAMQRVEIERHRFGGRDNLPTGSSLIPSHCLFQLVSLLEASLSAEIELTPPDYGQRERIEHVQRVVHRVRRSIVPDSFVFRLLARHLLDDSTDSDGELNWLQQWADVFQSEPPADEPLNLVVRTAAPTPEADLDTDDDYQLSTAMEILIPGLRSVYEDDRVKDDSFATTAIASLRRSNYQQLDFSRDVNWAALLGAAQLIVEKPHALWRMLSSMMFSAGGRSRDLMLQQLFARGSVINDLKQQFSSYQSDLATTLSLDYSEDCECDDPNRSKTQDADCPELCSGKGDRDEYRLRLHSSTGSSTVREIVCPVYSTTIRNSLQTFEAKLNSGESTDDAMEELRRVGRSLGEDIIQDLADGLADEFNSMSHPTTVAPHLRFQIPVELMAHPWELMSDKQGMLFDRFAMGRQFFTNNLDSHTPRQRSGGPLRVLILGDPKFEDALRRDHKHLPSQLPGAREEATVVRDLFRSLREELRGIADIWIETHIHTSITVNMVRALLRSGRFDLIHYAGHACFNPDDPEGSAWVLSDGLLHAREIRNTLRWCEWPPWLVYANACEAGMDRPRDAQNVRYQGDVFGLGSAFTNHGVRGYIAPLWPINDDVAVQLATDFYTSLLRERFSLGEALWQAKQQARTELLGADGRSQGSEMPARVALSWASVILYGDPTQRLFQSLWGGAAAASSNGDEPDAVDQSSPRFPGDSPNVEFSNPPAWTPPKNYRRAPRFQQATARAVLDSIVSPGLARIENSREVSPRLGEKLVELVEQDGIRFWQVVNTETGKRETLPGSTLQQRISTDIVRGHLGCNRGLLDYPVVLGRWAVKSLLGSEQQPLLTQMAEQFDRDTVDREQLKLVQDDLSLRPVSRGAWKPLGKDERVLLLIHGTFSNLKSPAHGFGKDFLNRFRRTHRIIGYDHWTLSKSPEENAAGLKTALQSLSDPRLLGANRLDIIVHSRGGLVARSFVELQEMHAAVRNVIFLGTPNAGTQLANPRNFGRLADYMVNLASFDQFGFFSKVSGLLVELMVHATMPDIPGLFMQNPQTRSNETATLNKLHVQPTPLFSGTGVAGSSHDHTRYSCVSANYEISPDDAELDITSLGKFLALRGLDESIDSLFDVTNDLVVDTHGVWAFRQPSQSMLTATDPIPPERILVFNPSTETPLPSGVRLFQKSRIHHCNLFQQRETQDFIAGLLQGPSV